VPEDLVKYHNPQISTFKITLGEDEIVFVLREDQSLRTDLNRLENRSLDPSPFVEIKSSPMGGLGLFATKDFIPGELILSERPMVSV
jgi:hypothetical protein